MIRHSALVLVVLAASTGFAADSSLLNMVMPDVRVISGVHVAQTLASPFGQHLLAQMSASDPDFQKLIADTGFDPRRDLTEVLLASNDHTATPGKHPGNGLVLVQGAFDVSRILAKAKADGATVSSFNGADVITKGNGDGWIALLDAKTAVAGPIDQVKGAIARRATTTQIDPKVVAKITDLAGRSDAWFLSLVPLSQVAPSNDQLQLNGSPVNANLLQSIQQASGGVKFGLTVLINGEAVTRSDKDATALADVVRFLAGMVQVNRNDPNAGKLASLLDSLVLSTEANVMKLSLAIAESDIEQLMPAHRATVGKAAIRH